MSAPKVYTSDGNAERCRVTGKVCFRSEHACKQSMAARGRRKGSRLRGYFCHECRSWHLSSRMGGE